MHKSPQFEIYNASAGSGKTYTLVKKYLIILLSDPSKYHQEFKHILAITFTNKAVAEMKDRVLKKLVAFSKKEILEGNDTMFNELCEILKVTKHDLHSTSERVLNTIIHNYAAFEISTIDKFNQKIVRTFAYDLNLPIDFEIELDSDSLLVESIDKMIAKVGGENQELTQVLVKYALEIADDGKSLNIEKNIFEVAKKLNYESEKAFIKQLDNKTLADFVNLAKSLKNKIIEHKTNAVKTATYFFSLIEQQGISESDFKNSSIPNYFKKYINNDFSFEFSPKTLWQNNIETTPLYKVIVKPDIKAAIDTLQPEIVNLFRTSLAANYSIKCIENILQNITQVSLLSEINNNLTALKNEKNSIFISDFNTLISKEINGQPTPFIYERLGEKYNHFFVDEFQDTSEIQWQNLVPLLDNSLSSNETGKVLLVGDAKQAIYQWRGGKAQQFINLCQGISPFYITPCITTLADNYRSCAEIVNFNNTFFNHIANTKLSDSNYAELYQNAAQNITKTEGGYVEISFLDTKVVDEDEAGESITKDTVYGEAVLNKIITLTQNHLFDYKDICILVRKNEEGISLANYLSNHNIPIVSSESLLLKNAPEVKFLIVFLKYFIQPLNKELKIKVLQLYAQQQQVENTHAFFSDHINLSFHQFLNALHLNASQLRQMQLYEMMETLIRHFGFNSTPNAYVQFFLDFVFNFTQKKGSNISEFLSHFEAKKKNLSVVTTKAQNAVQIMTVHKSKGLEFPVVIMPYAETALNPTNENKKWFPVTEHDFNDFEFLLININKEVAYYNNAQAYYQNIKNEQLLESLNVLYVALTRPVSHLYILAPQNKTTGGDTTYAHLFVSYLKAIQVWQEEQYTYCFGTPNSKINIIENPENCIALTQFISNPKEANNIHILTKAGLLWDSNVSDAIEKGNLIHLILSKIYTLEDVEPVINNFIASGTITKSQSEAVLKTLLAIITHSKLKSFYTLNYTIYNERDIFTKAGTIIRPDRLAINTQNEVVIIDYKTGAYHDTHKLQLNQYQQAIEDMQFKVINKILVYTNNAIEVIIY